MEKREWVYNGNSYIKSFDDWYLSFNNNHINLSNEPELAIVKERKFAILYKATKEMFDEVYTYEQAIKLGEKLVREGICYNAFWTEYDFKCKKWYK